MRLAWATVRRSSTWRPMVMPEMPSSFSSSDATCCHAAPHVKGGCRAAQLSGVDLSARRGAATRRQLAKCVCDSQTCNQVAAMSWAYHCTGSSRAAPPHEKDLGTQADGYCNTKQGRAPPRWTGARWWARCPAPPRPPPPAAAPRPASPSAGPTAGAGTHTAAGYRVQHASHAQGAAGLPWRVSTRLAAPSTVKLQKHTGVMCLPVQRLRTSSAATRTMCSPASEGICSGTCMRLSDSCTRAFSWSTDVTLHCTTSPGRTTCSGRMTRSHDSSLL